MQLAFALTEHTTNPERVWVKRSATRTQLDLLGMRSWIRLDLSDTTPGHPRGCVSPTYVARWQLLGTRGRGSAAALEDRP
jgi:hypothetical protein